MEPIFEPWLHAGALATCWSPGYVLEPWLRAGTVEPWLRAGALAYVLDIWLYAY